MQSIWVFKNQEYTIIWSFAEAMYNYLKLGNLFFFAE